ncbi:MAG: OmpA family protein [Burkholderiales bacterium]|nr:OmpA family protein [Burkholderiales bacterium]
MDTTRRTLSMAAVWCAAAGLPGCASPGPVVGLSPEQVAGLQALGFERDAEGWLLNLGTRLQFDFGSSTLTTGALASLQRLATTLIELKIRACRVEGHADEVGTVVFNQLLSERRAEAVARALVAAGLPYEGIRAVGFGKRKPVSDNQTDEGRAQNRRVVLIALAPK